VVAAVASWAVPSSALAARWLRPVPGEVARPFAYARATPFVAGAHRGADLAAAAGSPVRAACAGVVMYAGPVPGGERAVSVRCDGPLAARLRATYLPLARVAVAEGAAVRAGAPLGTLAGGHGGLHLGVRREGDPLGYIDPLPLLAPRTVPLRPAVRLPRPRAAPPPAAPAVPAVPAVPAAPRASPARPVSAPRARGPAPWPVWVGAALVACGAAGSGTLAVRRRRRRCGMPRRSARAPA
jgi:hypothetical protein